MLVGTQSIVKIIILRLHAIYLCVVPSPRILRLQSNSFLILFARIAGRESHSRFGEQRLCKPS